MAYELIPMYTPIPKGRQLNVNYKSWIAPREYDALNEKGCVPGVKETFSLFLSGLRLSFKGSSFFGSFEQGCTGTQSILL